MAQPYFKGSRVLFVKVFRLLNLLEITQKIGVFCYDGLSKTPTLFGRSKGRIADTRIVGRRQIPMARQPNLALSQGFDAKPVALARAGFG